MNIPIIAAIMALIAVWIEIRRLNAENLDLYFDKLEANKRTEQRNLDVLILEKKYDKLLGEKVQMEHIAKNAADALKRITIEDGKMIYALRAELRRKHRKVVA